MSMDEMGMFGDMMDQRLFRQGVAATITKLGETTIPELASGLGDDGMGFEMLAEQTKLPEKLVRPGDKWETDLGIPMVGGGGSGLAGAAVETVLEGIETVDGRLCAKTVMQVDTDISQLMLGQPGVPATGMPEMRITGQDTMYFDIEGGHVLRQTGQFSMNIGGGAFPGGQGLGGGGTMSIAMKAELRE